ncbi:hypothetical protein, partial [Staphylococcus lutrae]
LFDTEALLTVDNDLLFDTDCDVLAELAFASLSEFDILADCDSLLDIESDFDVDPLFVTDCEALTEFAFASLSEFDRLVDCDSLFDTEALLTVDNDLLFDTDCDVLAEL